MKLLALACVLAMPTIASAQYYQTDFPPEEFKARHATVFDRIGANAVAVVQGVSQTEGFTLPRQHNTFYYLSGIETPGAYLLLDGRTRTVTIYLPPRNARLEAAEGRVVSADDLDLVKRIAGVDTVKPVTDMRDGNWPLVAASGTGGGGPGATAIYAEFSPAENLGQSRGELVAAETARAIDFWDGAPSRHRRFVELLRTRHPRADVRNLTPILDEMRSIKSVREIAMIRRASQIAGLGVMEAMRSAEPGVTEYQLDAAAHYVFKVNDARLEGYRSITASGTDNITNMHYFRNTSTLKDGDLVLMDYAPDYRYYVSDIGRVFPVNGRYTAWQRELLQFVLEYHKAVMTRIRPGVTPAQIRAEAAKAMEAVFARTKFSKPIYEKAARTLVETGGGVFSHTVGMAVHDVGSYAGAALKPGQVFSVDPQLRVPEENLYLRYEDTIVVTDTGYENFTDFLPMELDEIEKLVQEKGVVQKVPAIPASLLLRRQAGLDQPRAVDLHQVVNTAADARDAGRGALLRRHENRHVVVMVTSVCGVGEFYPGVSYQEILAGIRPGLL
jgi:Xaa-Pro aminopeptidase